jgi:hypothetical protein
MEVGSYHCEGLVDFYPAIPSTSSYRSAVTITSIAAGLWEISIFGVASIRTPERLRVMTVHGSFGGKVVSRHGNVFSVMTDGQCGFYSQAVSFF